MATNQKCNLQIAGMRRSVVLGGSTASVVNERRLSFSDCIQQSSEPYCEIDILSECSNNLSRIGIHHSKSTNGSLSSQCDQNFV